VCQNLRLAKWRYALTANESHSYSLFFIASERDILREKEEKKIFVLLARERFQFAELVVFPRENTYT